MDFIASIILKINNFNSSPFNAHFCVVPGYNKPHVSLLISAELLQHTSSSARRFTGRFVAIRQNFLLVCEFNHQNMTEADS